MANEDIPRLSTAALRRELRRLSDADRIYQAELSRLLPLVGEQEGTRRGRFVDFGLGLVSTVAGFATMSVSMPVIGVIGLFGGAVGLYRAGLSAFKGAAADGVLAAELDRVRDQLSVNRLRAEAITAELRSRG